METTIYLIRHAETDCNREGRYQGQQDIPLNDFGKSQAIKLAQRLYDEVINIDVIYTSDLGRAKETALSIAQKYNLEVNIDLNLRERYFGKFEGLKAKEVQLLYGDFDILKCNESNIYDIETYESLKSRVYNSIYNICKNHINNNIVIVSHGAVINSFLREINKGKLELDNFRLNNTGISTIVYNHQNSEWEIIRINDIAHIESSEGREK